MKPLLYFLCLSLISCGNSSSKKEDPEKKAKPRTLVVGRIASVATSGDFVLIQKFGPGALPTDTIYQTEGEEGRKASIRPSGERVRDFFAADLLNGTVKKNDKVVAYPDPKKKPTDEEEAEDEDESLETDPDAKTEKSDEKTPDLEKKPKEETTSGASQDTPIPLEN